jgi:HprK-related kinase A
VLILSACSAEELKVAIRLGRFRLHVGHLRLKISSVVPEFICVLQQLYAAHPVMLEGGDFDFEIAISPPTPWRHWLRRNAIFKFCGDAPFEPMEVGHAFAMFEWGLNWAIASYLHNYLILHSAVVEFEGNGVLLSAVSGSGKSTLSAELSLQGWRLLSDELALIDDDLQLFPLARPISLKNSSIDLIRTRFPSARLGPLAKDTHKGTVAHLMAPDASVELNLVPSIPKFVIFPKWTAGAPLRVEAVGSGQAAMRLIDQAFNYSILGQTGFERLVALVRQAEAWEIEYSSLDEAREAIESLVRERG